MVSNNVYHNPFVKGIQSKTNYTNLNDMIKNENTQIKNRKSRMSNKFGNKNKIKYTNPIYTKALKSLKQTNFNTPILTKIMLSNLNRESPIEKIKNSKSTFKKPVIKLNENSIITTKKKKDKKKKLINEIKKLKSQIPKLYNLNLLSTNKLKSVNKNKTDYNPIKEVISYSNTLDLNNAHSLSNKTLINKSIVINYEEPVISPIKK